MTEERERLPEAGRELIEKLERGGATTAVVGLGYVGLPLALVLAEAGFQVIGIDTSSQKVAKLRGAESYVEDIPDERVASAVGSGRLSVHTDYAVLRRADAISICVPTPLRKTGDPDLTFILSAVEAMKPYMHAGMVVVLESTTYPGTTREMVLPEIEDGELTVGENIFLAFSPERVDPGRTDWTTENTPKVIGGITNACTKVAATYYRQALETVIEVSSTEVAEMAKLLENTFRAVNIGMANEMALMCNRLGIDVWEVIEAAASKPFGFMKFTPGPGLGGHCIPIDPLYLSWKLKSVKYNARFIDLASEINTNMPRYVVARLQDALNEQEKSIKGSKLLVLGVAYKPNVSDTRESPALDVIGLLQEKGAAVEYYDPYVPVVEHEGWQLKSLEDVDAAVAGYDAIIIVTDHGELDYRALAERAPLTFDTRNAVRAEGELAKKVYKL